ncbi:MAG: Gfo/Idh/MocA family oxidoreductase [Phycisphaerae bacterium]
MRTSRTTRRRFLAGAASAAAVGVVARHVVARADKSPPSEKLNIAGIGIGGMGAADLRHLESQHIVALCDVDRRYAAGTFKRYPKATVYTDYRRMLEKEKGIDAVVVATPDHTHAVISMACMTAGKHVYCQKPLTHDVREARRLAETAEETGVTTQMGIQGHSKDGCRLIVEWIRAGVIGEVRQVDAWCSLSYYPWGHASWSSPWAGGERPKETPPVPDTLDWDLWIGPAAMRPYHPAYHPRVWRCWLDFGSGMMGDRGAHTLDPVFWALDLGAPESVEATSCGQTKEKHALAAMVTYRFGARGSRPPVLLTWYEGTRAPRPPELEDGRVMGDREGGVIFHGSKGKLMCGTYGNGPRLIPESRMKGFKPPQPTLPRVRTSHEMEWIEAAKAGRPAGAHFGYAGPLTEVCVLGNVAKRADGRIVWDAENLKVTNRNDAAPYIAAPYREGWSL